MLGFLDSGFGGPTYTFLEPLFTDNLYIDLMSLYEGLIDLGVEWRNGEVALNDLR
jgi:hypothetical protein